MTKKVIKRASKKPVINTKGFFTKDKQMAFCEALITNNYSISSACKAVGISRTTYYHNMNFNEEFKQMLYFTNTFTKNIIKDAILEGILHSDLTLRYKYLSILSENIIAESLGFEKGENKSLTFVLDKKDIKLG